MKHIFIINIIIALLSGCAAPTSLYTWSNYSTLAHNYLKNSDETSTTKLFNGYDEVINNQRGTRSAVPPGIYADYAFLLLEQGKVERAREMLNKEMTLYPESKVFIEHILKMIEE